MIAVAQEVGPRRFRESYGRYFEDFTVGDVYEHRPGRTISEADNTWFTLLTMNQHPLHFDAVCGQERVWAAGGQQLSHAGDRRRHERQRRQPEGDRQPRLE